MRRTRFTSPVSAVALAALSACSDGTAPVATTDLGVLIDRKSESCKPATPDELIPLPIAPRSQRVDLLVPSFSNPTNVTNPLFPISQLAQVILLGNVDGVPLRVETTLLPDIRTIDLGDRRVQTRVSQYIAYLDRRIEEVALDFYGQADDGAAWYFGEDVFNFENGVIVDTDGTWLACRDGPVAMIMPANPKVGDVYRPENIFDLVFEEVTVKSTGVTVDGPHGPVAGAIIVEELHMDGSTEAKIFAPGYGEFSTGSGSNVEAVALAVPTDALPGPPPGTLLTVHSEALKIFDVARSGNWAAASVAAQNIQAAWNTYKTGGVPPMLETQMNVALAALHEAVAAQNRAGARQAALDVDLAGFDFQLRYLPPVTIDFARLDLWARQLLLDAEASDKGGVTSDVAILDRIWDRVAHAVPSRDAKRVNAQLTRLASLAERADFVAILDAARKLRQSLRAIASNV